MANDNAVQRDLEDWRAQRRQQRRDEASARQRHEDRIDALINPVVAAWLPSWRQLEDGAPVNWGHSAQRFEAAMQMHQELFVAVKSWLPQMCNVDRGMEERNLLADALWTLLPLITSPVKFPWVLGSSDCLQRFARSRLYDRPFNDPVLTRAYELAFAEAEDLLCYQARMKAAWRVEHDADHELLPRAFLARFEMRVDTAADWEKSRQFAQRLQQLSAGPSSLMVDGLLQLQEAMRFAVDSPSLATLQQRLCDASRHLMFVLGQFREQMEELLPVRTSSRQLLLNRQTAWLCLTVKRPLVMEVHEVVLSYLIEMGEMPIAVDGIVQWHGQEWDAHPEFKPDWPKPREMW